MSSKCKQKFINRNSKKGQIWDAARNGNVMKVKQLLPHFAPDVEVLNVALIQACEKNQLNVVKCLLEHRAVNVNFRGDVFTPLTAACIRGNLDIVKYMLTVSYINCNLQDNRGFTPLLVTCLNVQLTLSKYLLSDIRDINVNVADPEGNSALFYAISHGRKRGENQLHMACRSGDLSQVCTLIEVFDRLINITTNDGNTPLHIACAYGHEEVARNLMLDGADVDVTNDFKETPEQIAEKGGHVHIVKLFHQF